MNGKDKTQLITKPLNLRFRISNCRPSRVFLTPQILDWNYYCFCFKIIFNKFLQLRVLFAAVHLINTEWGVFFINLKRTQSLSTVAAKSCRHIHKLNAKRKKPQYEQTFSAPSSSSSSCFFQDKGVAGDRLINGATPPAFVRTPWQPTLYMLLYSPLNQSYIFVHDFLFVNAKAQWFLKRTTNCIKLISFN